MAIIKQSNVKGIDQSIQSFQSFIYTALCGVWGLSGTDWDCYDRAYRNQSKDGYYPEVFKGNSTGVAKSQDYKEALFNDAVKVQSFFLLGDDTKIAGVKATVQVSLIFMLNVPKIKTGATNRADEKIRNDVIRQCMYERYGFKVSGISTGIDSVFKEFSGWKKKEGIKSRDIHPWHCFRIDFEVSYTVFQ